MAKMAEVEPSGRLIGQGSDRCQRGHGDERGYQGTSHTRTSEVHMLTGRGAHE